MPETAPDGTPRFQALGDVERKSDSEKADLGDEFLSNADRKKLGMKIGELVGPQWLELDDDVRRSIVGAVSKMVTGSLGERLALLTIDPFLRRHGMEVFGLNVDLNYGGVNFNIDFVGMRPGAAPTMRTDLDTIRVGNERYLLSDLRFLDSKVGLGPWSEAQRNARAVSPKLRLERYQPLFTDLPEQDLIEMLNALPQLRATGIQISLENLRKFKSSLPLGTTLASALMVLLGGEMAKQMFLQYESDGSIQ